jgi:molybdopterin molybdotransferase
MDGYALRAVDVAVATENNPVHLRVAGTIAAGAAAATPVEPQSCVRIFTGAPIPPGADAVVMQEDTRPHHEGYIAVLEAVAAGENIRRTGEDVQAGHVVIPAGAKLGAAQLGMAAAVGLPEVTVHPHPRIGVLVTGAEVVEPGRPLQAGQIYDSNSFTIGGLIRQAGAELVNLGIADDTREALQEKLEYALAECDVVITSGGVSVGEYDLVKDVFRDLGCAQQFWKVAMKPGKPFVFGTREHRLVFGLPGNPVSAAVTFLLLVRPALLRLRGLKDVDLPVVTVETGEDFVNRGDRPHYMRARLENGKVTLAGRQGSHVISSLTEANCLVEIPACRTLTKGSSVTALRFA